MVGLVFAEELRLSAPQWLAQILNTAVWLWFYRQTYRRTALSGTREPWQGCGDFILTALLSLSALWIVFWNTPTSIDQQMLFEQARYLGRYAWPEFLEAIVSRPYVEYQPPFFTFWISRLPIFWAQQLLFFPFGLLCVALMFRLYGRPAALLCATPVFALMIHQPCSDTLLFGCLLIVLRLIQLSQTTHPPAPSLAKRGGGFLFSRSTLRVECRTGRSASFVYGLSWPIKPLTILTVPFLLPQLGLSGLGSLGLWGGYILWSRRWEFGRRQFAFLLHQLALKSMKRPGRQRLRPPSQRSPLGQLRRGIWGTFFWRWKRLGRRALAALPFYLFPAWLRPWTWKGIFLAAIVVLGYGNSKYLLLDLLFLFPVRQDVPPVPPRRAREKKNKRP